MERAHVCHQIDSVRSKCERMQEAQLLCEQVPRRLDMTQKQDLVSSSADAMRFKNAIAAVLDEFATFLDRYLDQPQSFLWRIYLQQSVVDAVEHAHRALDDILTDTEQKTSQDSSPFWYQDMICARELQQQQLKQLFDQARLTVNDQDMIDLILKKFKAETQRKRSIQMTEGDLKVLEWKDMIYFKLFRLKKSLPNDVPEWFIAPEDVEIDMNQSSINLGSDGNVYNGMWRLGTKVSIHKLPINDTNTKAMMKEADLWSRLNHPHIMKLFGACHEDQPFFVCEDAVRGHLGNYLSKPQNQQKTWRLLYEASLGIYYLHSQRIAHGDLRCHNIRIGVDGKAKLSNFNYSVKRDEVPATSVTSNTSSMRWTAPECLEEFSPSFAADIYSFGMSIIEATTGKPPWELSEDDTAVKAFVSSGRLPMQPSPLDDAAWQFVQQMCAHEPTARPSIITVVDELNRLMRNEAAETELMVSKKNKFCTNCGNSMPGSANFCNKCGKRVGDRPIRVASCA